MEGKKRYRFAEGMRMAGATVLCAVAAVAFFSACGGGTKSGVLVDSGITVILPIDDTTGHSYDTISLGRVPEGEVVEGTFMIENRGAQPLVIIQVITGCGCTTVDYAPDPIAGNASRQVKFRFDSKERFGHQFKSIEIITAQRQVATVYLDAEVYMPEK